MLQLPIDDFPATFEAALDDVDGVNEDIDVKMARLDVTTLDHVDLFLFRRDQRRGMRTISTLAAEPHRMSLSSQIMYKWILPSLKEARYAVERAAGQAIDMGVTTERNSLMYESADALARLYSPLFDMDDTFVLQEYFVPRGAFALWVDAARPVYKLTTRLPDIEVLNTTIRFVHKDVDTALAYSRVDGGSYAFVLYFRVRRTDEADAQLAQVHTLLAQGSLALGGTFYLPYRHHYTDEEMDAAYPQAASFFRCKQRYDPGGRVRSLGRYRWRQKRTMGWVPVS
jgi:FAD/FMN-containing dehydrogenase